MKDTKLFSTVTAGRLKNKKIFLPDKSVTRSTKNIIRSAVFNSLFVELYGSLFVEMFAGSGSMGIEAISRGAGHAVFVEKDRDSFMCLKKNINDLGITECKLYNADSFLIYEDILSYIDSLHMGTFLYFDPPFDIRDGMDNIYQNCIDLISRTKKNNIRKIFLEHITSFEAPEVVGFFTKCKTRKFGKTTISEYE